MEVFRREAGVSFVPGIKHKHKLEEIKNGKTFIRFQNLCFITKGTDDNLCIKTVFI